MVLCEHDKAFGFDSDLEGNLAPPLGVWSAGAGEGMKCGLSRT